ncbi:F-box/kelch-repeat protein [Actinidia chinensis var. chinensis]|uniref:F-box/kelch-repeat protein n=1 Tax=Actinidia chinensis var. chinensis TaxID=1590841 RepID=A0A2R6QH04_ACTCC|nr:F-box/kelch-repeat protein [Actinidia chinensis var. chinensis]
MIGVRSTFPTLPTKFDAMLEGPSFLVSRELPSSCEHESKWIYNKFCVIELSNGEHRLDNGEGTFLRKSSKWSDAIEREETVQGLSDLSLSQADQSNDQRQNGDHSNSSSLIHQIGRDISINCLLHCSRSDYDSIASLNRSFRSLVRGGELYRLRQQMGIIEHWVYFSCKLLEWEAFDPVRLRWMHLPRMTSNECFMWSDKESLAVGTELLVFGKEIMSHVVYRYSILTNSWSFGTAMNNPRCLFASASLGEIAIVAGGCDPKANILNSAELYNSDTGTWVTLPRMNKHRKMCSGVFMDGKFYVIGGIGVGNPNELTCGEMYDLETRMWYEIPNMFPVHNRNAGATDTPATAKAPPLLAVVKNELYAAYYTEQEVRKYDKERNLWVTVGGLPERAVSMNGWGLAFRACGDRLIVLGGPRALDGGIIEVNAWEPAQGPSHWSLLASKHSGSFVYNCAVMGC